MKTRINGYDVIHTVKETGEIICETSGCTSIEDTNLSTSELKRREYLNSHVANFNKGESFVKLFTDTAFILSKNLPPKEFMVTVAICKFVSYEDCVLRIGHGKSMRAMTLRDISEQLEIDYTRITRIVNSLVAKGVIGEFTTGNINDGKKTKVYILNPYIYINGKSPDIDVCRYFDETGWRELLENKR
jgi:hypothetical protein